VLSSGELYRNLGEFATVDGAGGAEAGAGWDIWDTWDIWDGVSIAWMRFLRGDKWAWTRDELIIGKHIITCESCWRILTI